MNVRMSYTRSKGSNNWAFIDEKPRVKQCVYFARHTLALVLTGSLIVGACADAPTATTESSRSSSASLAISMPSAGPSVAQGLAIAMRDASVRSRVHRAMRASLLNEHKLVLQDFLSTSEGQELFAAASAGLNLTSEAFQSRIASLPRLDFYVSFKAHRLTWKAGSDVYVAMNFDADAPSITAYGSDGQTITLRKDQGVPSVPLILLHPAEPTATRGTPQANAPGDVIQDSTDGAVATRYATSLGPIPGPAFVIEPGDGGGGGGSPPPPAPGVYIDHFNIQEGDGWWGQSEMQFQSFAVVGYRGFVGPDPDNQFLVSDDICPLGTYAQDGVEEDQGYYGLFFISPGVTAGTYLQCHSQPAVYAIHIVEIDGGLTGDNDDFGWRFYALGGYPFGATYNTVQSYYANTWNQQLRTAYLRITIK